MRMKRGKVQFKPPRVQEMREAAAAIRQGHRKPLVAAIGACSPFEPYSLAMGVKVGHDIAQAMWLSGAGSLFTGGMGGVGVDIYTGVTRFRISYPFERSFILIPERESYGIIGFEERILPFEENECYAKLAILTDDVVRKERAGDSLEERRICLAHTADFAVCLSGTGGTLDEAAMMIREGKPIITCAETGGISELLQTYKSWVTGHVGSAQGLIYMEKVMREMPIHFDPDLIVVTQTVEEAVAEVIRRLKEAP